MIFVILIKSKATTKKKKTSIYLNRIFQLTRTDGNDASIKQIFYLSLRKGVVEYLTVHVLCNKGTRMVSRLFISSNQIAHTSITSEIISIHNRCARRLFHLSFYSISFSFFFFNLAY